jgi:hypothetical protein
MRLKTGAYDVPRDRRTDVANRTLEAVENAMDSAINTAFGRIDNFTDLDPELIPEAIKHLYGWEMADAWEEWVSA